MGNNQAVKVHCAPGGRKLRPKATLSIVRWNRKEAGWQGEEPWRAKSWADEEKSHARTDESAEQDKVQCCPNPVQYMRRRAPYKGEGARQGHDNAAGSCGRGWNGRAAFYGLR